MMTRRLVVLGAAALALSACSGNLIGPPEGGPIYVVRPSFPPAPAGGAKVAWSLSILRPDAPAGLDTDRISLMQPDGSLEYYAHATYPERLTSQIQRALLDGFETSGRIDAVAREEEALHADYNLLIEVKDFQAHYASADGIPTVRVAMMAKLVATHGRKIVSSQSFTQSGSAGVNSAAAAVQALQQALGASVAQIVTWTLAAPAPALPGAPLEPASPSRPAAQLMRDGARGTTRLRDRTGN